MKQLLQQLSLVLPFYNPRSENIIIGDFNMTVENHDLSDFMQAFDLSCLVTKPNCYQSKIAICIDLMLTNRKNLFILCDNFETGLSDHYMLKSTITKSGNFKGLLINLINL